MLQMGDVLKELGDMMRLGALAYLFCHKELLEKENYNCVYKILMYAEAKQFSNQSVNKAYSMAESAIKTFAKYMLPEDIESYKKHVDNLAEFVMKYDFVSKTKETDFFNY